MRRVFGAAAILLAGVAADAWADEVWVTAELGEVIYEADLNGTAILLGTAPEGGAIRLYFPGLAGNYSDRSAHDGFWIQEGPGPCAAKMTGPDGMASTNWGSARILFDDPAFPTAWTLLGGQCFDPMDVYVRGTVPDF